MAGVYELVKNRKTYSIEANQTVTEAARLMAERNIGAVVVLRDGKLAAICADQELLGLVSLRDILLHSASRRPGLAAS